MKQAIRLSLRLLWGVIGLAMFGGLLYTAFTPYETFTTEVLRQVHKLDWRAYFQSNVLPKQRYTLLPYLLGGGVFLWLLLSPWYYRKSRQWSRLIYLFVQMSRQQQRLFWRQCNCSERYLLGFIIGAAIIRMIYYTGHYALQYDEAWTYNHFVSNGPIVSAVSPNNNHILYTLLAWLTNWLPLSGQYSLRLPVLLGGIVLLFVFYKLARQASTRNAALLSLTFLAFAPAASLYSLYARGYIFQLLFTVVAVSATWHLVTQKNKQIYHWTWWSLALIFGLYSVPTQVYVCVVLSLYLLWKERASKQFLYYWFWANILVVATVALLYAPFFLTNGSRTLIDAVQASNSRFSWSYQDRVADWLLWGGGRGTQVYGFWLALFGCLFFLYYKNKITPSLRPLTEIVLLFLLLPTLLNLILGTQPPYRIWCFLGPFLALWVLLVSQALAPRWASSKRLLLGLVVIISLYSWRLERHYALQWSAKLDWQVQHIAQTLLAHQLSSCYLFSNYDKPLLEYYYLRQGKRLTVYMSSKVSQHYMPFEQLPLYDAVLWDSEDRVSSPKERAWLTRYYPVVLYKDARVQLRVPSS